MTRFTLRHLFVWTTVIAICIAVFMGVWSLVDGSGAFFQLVYATCAAIAIAGFCLAVVVSFEPLILPTPDSILAAERIAADENAGNDRPQIRTGLLSILLAVITALPPTLCLGVVGLLIASQWDGETSLEFSEFGWNWLVVVLFTFSGCAIGVTAGLLAGLFCGSPLGWPSKYWFYFTILAFGLNLCYALVFLSAIAAIIVAALLLVIVGAGLFLDRRVLGYVARARRWSARAAAISAVVVVIGWVVAAGLGDVSLYALESFALVAIPIILIAAVVAAICGAVRKPSARGSTPPVGK